MTVVQFTDTHIAADGRPHALTSDTAADLEHAVRFVNAMRPLPDAVICTGDLAHAGSTAEYERFRGIVDDLAVPYYVLPGNHDRHDALRATFVDHAYLPAGTRELNYAVEAAGGRIVSLDTNVPRRRYGAALSDDSLAWLERTLAESDRPTLLAMHHPPFRSGLPYLDFKGFAGLDRFRAIVRRHGHVKLIVAGHIHCSIERRFTGARARTSISTARQIVPLLFAFPPRVWWWQPPGFSVHRVACDRATSETYHGDGHGNFAKAGR
jgi:3',5'-cyclic AMP phosphodiesterase CpdA